MIAIELQAMAPQSCVSLLFELKYCPDCHGNLFMANPTAFEHNVSDEPRALFRPCPHCLQCIETFMASRMQRYPEEGTQKAGGGAA